MRRARRRSKRSLYDGRATHGRMNATLGLDQGRVEKIYVSMRFFCTWLVVCRFACLRSTTPLVREPLPAEFVQIRWRRCLTRINRFAYIEGPIEYTISRNLGKVNRPSWNAFLHRFGTKFAAPRSPGAPRTASAYDVWLHLERVK